MAGLRMEDRGPWVLGGKQQDPSRQQATTRGACSWPSEERGCNPGCAGAEERAAEPALSREPSWLPSTGREEGSGQGRPSCLPAQTRGEMVRAVASWTRPFFPSLPGGPADWPGLLPPLPPTLSPECVALVGGHISGPCGRCGSRL